MRADLERVRQAVAGFTKPRVARDFKDALGINNSLRMRQVEIIALSKTLPTCTINIGGSSRNTTTIPYFSCLPCPGYAAWAITDDQSMWVWASQGPAPTMRLSHTGTQNHTNTGNEQNVDFQNPMPSGVPGNGGWDFWALWDSGQSTRIPLPAPGMYQVNANLSFAANATGRRYVFIRRVDNSNEVAREDEHTLTNTIVSMTANTLIKVPDATGVDLQMVAFQNSGGNLGYVTSASANQFYSPMLSWAWMGPYGA